MRRSSSPSSNWAILATILAGMLVPGCTETTPGNQTPVEPELPSDPVEVVHFVNESFTFTLGPYPDEVPAGAGFNHNCVSLRADGAFQVVNGSASLAWDAAAEPAMNLDLLAVFRDAFQASSGNGGSPRTLAVDAFPEIPADGTLYIVADRRPNDIPPASDVVLTLNLSVKGNLPQAADAYCSFS